MLSERLDAVADKLIQARLPPVCSVEDFKHIRPLSYQHGVFQFDTKIPEKKLYESLYEGEQIIAEELLHEDCDSDGNCPTHTFNLFELQYACNKMVLSGNPTYQQCVREILKGTPDNVDGCEMFLTQFAVFDDVKYG